MRIPAFLLLYSFVFFLHTNSASQTSSSQILQDLKKLNTTASVLYIAAHPDDENTRLLAYLANEKKVRTAYLSITRGDGGQNLIGKEQGELLGLIRTQELLAARRTDGAEQFFTRANDFGYSKNPEETLEFWNKDSILSDMVWIIRQFRPDIIICRFPTTGEGGHGHHTASAILALEAFDAAADPNKFPAQLKTHGVWKCKRIFWNTFNFGGTNTTSPDQLKIDVGTYNALLGKSYGEIAAESRSMHKSQGFGSAKQRGSNLEYFKQLKGDSAKKDVFEGLNTKWDRMRGTEPLKQHIEECIKNFDAEAPEKSVSALIKIYKLIEALDEKDESINYWKKIKLRETEQLLLACAGIWAECTVKNYMGIPGSDVLLNSQLIVRTKTEVKLNSIKYSDQSDTVTALNLKQNELYSFKHTEKLASNLPYSQPYWLTHAHSSGLYTVANKSLTGTAQNKAAASVYFDLSIQDLSLRIERPVVYKQTDPVKGEVYRPFEVLPPLNISLPEKVIVFTDLNTKTIQITLKSHQANIKGTLKVKSSGDYSLKLPNENFELKNSGDELQLAIDIAPGKKAGNGKLEFSVMIGSASYSKSIQRIEYDHIPYQFTLSDAVAGLEFVDLKRSDSVIAYIPGAGDDVAACLKQTGYIVTVLKEDQLANEDLTNYSAIVMGIRAYNINEKLQVYHSKLMDYVNQGGNLIVQYNTNSRVGPLQAKTGPYPFSISRERVTDENAEVKFIKADHSALNFPNKITKKDFDGWVQERGIYFAEDLDAQYETILSMNDPKEKPHKGSLIIAKYGKGNFVYTGLAFFRQLPAGVPGAYRLFVNLLSLPKNN